MAAGFRHESGFQRTRLSEEREIRFDFRSNFVSGFYHVRAEIWIGFLAGWYENPEAIEVRVILATKKDRDF